MSGLFEVKIRRVTKFGNDITKTIYVRAKSSAEALKKTKDHALYNQIDWIGNIYEDSSIEILPDAKKVKIFEYIDIESLPDNEFNISIKAMPETIPLRGNLIDSGSDWQDRQYEDEAIEDLENGNEWRWCQVAVSVEFRGNVATTYLGGCSYESEEDFRKGGMLGQMIDECKKELMTTTYEKEIL